MSTTTSIAACTLFWLVVNVGLLQERGWRGIVPLHSTREDVERLVGRPMMPGGITYDLKTERVNVVYSTGSCREGGDEWNVPPGNVIGITVYPQTRLMLADLMIDLNRFEKFMNPRVGDRVSYSNTEEGIAIVATLNEEVISIQYLPQSKDDHLRCPGFPTRPLSNDELQYFKFDEYAKLSLADEKARLDNFAVRLQKTEKSRGYILAYAGRSTPSRAALARAKRAREYLMKRWRIETRRIEIRFAGKRPKASWELYLVPEDVQSQSSKSQ